jgi:6-pyruvoyltetrahydropterin/6-carboxytetrahydropterin synthase
MNASTETYTVRVSKDYLVFCSAHFITYEGNTCERLHGHNYRATAEVEGPLDQNHYVFDFIALKDVMRRITDELDHRVLLPTTSELIHVEATDRQVRARFADREWVFPREDCVLLPIANTTAELLARWIAGQVLDFLAREKSFHPVRLMVEVEESFGQLATYEVRP